MTQPTTSGSGAEFDAPSTVEPKKPGKSSLLDDFMDIFYAPSAVFARRANAGFWIPLLIVSALLGVMFFANRDLIEPIMDSEFSRNMARNPRMAQMTPDQVTTAKAFAGKIGMIAAFVFPARDAGARRRDLDRRQVLRFEADGECRDRRRGVLVRPRVVEGVVNRIEG
jgi:hypothetical protein